MDEARATVSDVAATNSLNETIDTLQKASLDTSLSLARARAGLVQELVEVFDIVEVGGRPSLLGNTKMALKGEWKIVDAVFPVPGDVRRYPIEDINATVIHTLHFIGLLTFYLGIKLPFEVSWGGPLETPSVGEPFIAAGHGSEAGGWAKWTDPYPLHLSPASSDKEKAKEEKDGQAFTTGLAMLLYNVVYLAHTQGVDVTLSQSGETLRNLWAVCCSAELGK